MFLPIVARPPMSCMKVKLVWERLGNSPGWSSWKTCSQRTNYQLGFQKLPNLDPASIFKRMALHLSEALNWVWAKPKILSQCFSDSFIVCRSFIFATSHDSVHPLTWCCSRLQRVTSVSASNILLIFSHNKVIQKSQDCVTKTWKPLQKNLHWTLIMAGVWMRDFYGPSK